MLLSSSTRRIFSAMVFPSHFCHLPANELSMPRIIERPPESAERLSQLPASHHFHRRRRAFSLKFLWNATLRFARGSATFLVEAAPESLFLTHSHTIQVIQVKYTILVQGRRIGRAGDGICGVHCGQRGKLCFGGFARMMVEGDGLHQWERESPNAHQVRAHFSVRASQAFPFEVRVDVGPQFKNLTVLSGHLREQDHLADIMQQSRSKALLYRCLRATLGGSDALGECRDRNAVVP